jgi:hypothetical protein
MAKVMTVGRFTANLNHAAAMSFLDLQRAGRRVRNLQGLPCNPDAAAKVSAAVVAFNEAQDAFGAAVARERRAANVARDVAR